jgi:two-component system response regulator AtoC
MTTEINELKHAVSSAEKVLIVDDEEVLRFMLKTFLAQEGYAPLEAADPREADAVIERERPDLILCDWRMPIEDGLSFLRRLNLPARVRGADPDVIFMSAHADVDTALKAIELGAVDYVSKPFELSDLSFRIRRALRERRLVARASAFGGDLDGESLQGMVGRSASMRAVFQLIERVAPTQSTVMITGQSGTGKELIARAIHALSPRRHAPFVAVNCAAIPEGLIESELFGHEQGAFTHAHAARKGLFEEASGGTLFLDEVAELPVQLQVKLLRTLQEREVKRVGSNHSVKVDVRVIAATLRDLEEEVHAGRFRSDLYFRLNVIPVQAPPLSARAEDIPLLADLFLRRAGARAGRPRLRLSPEALDALTRYRWPGNVRELENAIEHAVVLSTDELITPSALPLSRMQSPSPSAETFELIDMSIKRNTQRLEDLLIRRALTETNGVKAHAAQVLEISTKTLLYKMKDYGIITEGG